MSNSTERIVQLRQLLTDRFPHLRGGSDRKQSSAAVWPTGLAHLDARLQGGLPKGAITEMVAPHAAAGSTLLIHALLRQAQQNNQWLALVDGLDSFDPAPLNDSLLSRLLWVRCRQAREAMKAADLIARDSNLPLLLLDLRINPEPQLRKIQSTNWYRLQRCVEHNGIVLVALTPFAMVSSAQTRLTLETRFNLDDLMRDEEALLARQRFELSRDHGREFAREAMAEAG